MGADLWAAEQLERGSGGEEHGDAGLDLELGVRGQLLAAIQVSDRRMSSGRVLMVEMSAFFIVIAP